jgi:hypothetical protein
MGGIARFAAESNNHERKENGINSTGYAPANGFNNGLFVSIGHFDAKSLPQALMKVE